MSHKNLTITMWKDGRVSVRSKDETIATFIPAGYFANPDEDTVSVPKGKYADDANVLHCMTDLANAVYDFEEAMKDV